MILLFLIFAAIPNAKASKPVFTDALCEDTAKIAQEFMDLELAGYRWQGTLGKPRCLKDFHPQTILAEQVSDQDPAHLDPEYLLPNSRKVDLSVKRLPNELIEVTLSYIGKKTKLDQAVKDHFVFKLNYGHARELHGCASWQTPPTHFVMREKCWEE